MYCSDSGQKCLVSVGVGIPTVSFYGAEEFTFNHSCSGCYLNSVVIKCVLLLYSMLQSRQSKLQHREVTERGQVDGKGNEEEYAFSYRVSKASWGKGGFDMGCEGDRSGIKEHMEKEIREAVKRESFIVMVNFILTLGVSAHHFRHTPLPFFSTAKSPLHTAVFFMS